MGANFGMQAWLACAWVDRGVGGSISRRIARTDLLDIKARHDWIQQRQRWPAEVERPIVIVPRWETCVFASAQHAPAHRDAARILYEQTIEPIHGETYKEAHDGAPKKCYRYCREGNTECTAGKSFNGPSLKERGERSQEPTAEDPVENPALTSVLVAGAIVDCTAS
jgi:hypothetical protein